MYGVKNLSDVLRILSGADGAEALLIRNSEAYRKAMEEADVSFGRDGGMDFADIIGQ